LIGVAGGDIAGDPGPFVEVAPYGDVGWRGAAPTGLLNTAITPVEARHHLLFAVAGRSLCLDQSLHLSAPPFPIFGIADAAQVVEGAEDLGQAGEVIIERRRPALDDARGRACKKQDGAADGNEGCAHGLALICVTPWSTASGDCHGVSPRTVKAA